MPKDMLGGLKYPFYSYLADCTQRTCARHLHPASVSFPSNETVSWKNVATFIGDGSSAVCYRDRLPRRQRYC
jgi:hypothetical protein